FTVFLYMIKAREFLWELVEDVTGARLTISYGRVGGVKADLPEGFADKTLHAFKQTREVLDEVHRLLTGNRIFMDRMVGVGALPRGPINVDFEGRPIDPAAYVDRGKQGKTEGLLLIPITLSPNLQGQQRAAYGRVNVEDKRVVLPPKETAYGSIEGLMNHFMLIMEGYGIRPPAGEAYFPVAGADGELGLYVVSDGADRPSGGP